MIAYLYDDEDNETEVELEGYVSKYHPATMYKNNGDPGEPAEGGELEDFAIYLDGKDITDTISKEDYERLELYFMENWEEPELW
jgi:hypothetical protein